jgi:tripartite-type tricarboxylate transporter receptor subunit TctC
MPGALAMVQGSVQSMFSSPSTTLPLTKEGKIRALAVAGPKRDKNVPDVPTLAESGLAGFESNTWFALVASAKTPPEILEKIRTDAVRAMRSPAVLKRIDQINSVPVGNSSEEFRKVILSDFEVFKRVIATSK